METASSPTTVTLPDRLADVFRSLKAGKHICREDVADYRDLERHEELYQALFRGLGYTLVHHGQGFYYFKGGNSLTTQRLQGITLFMLILFQDLEDKKFNEADRAWERKLLTRSFRVDELPHFQTAQRRSMLFTVGVTPETLHEKVLRPMARYGMLEMTGADAFRLRSPIYRFVDLCMQFADEDWKSVPSSADEHAAPDDNGRAALTGEQTDSRWDEEEIENGDEAP